MSRVELGFGRNSQALPINRRADRDTDQARKRDALAAQIKANLVARKLAKAAAEAAQADDDLEATG